TNILSCKFFSISIFILYLQFSSECFCGNELNTTKRPEKECNMPCSGNKIQICGGNQKMSVYLV
ncbi:hypothetical protein FSP39_016819, partial [Pinctada imbricata]